MATSIKLISIVVPCYNEAENVNAFFIELKTILSKETKYSFEILFVNDGSKDNTLELIQAIAHKNSSVKVINLSRNFGKEIATTAGIFQATGSAIMMIDGDGQHPPELISQFIRKWERGYQVIIGVRLTNQREGFIKRFGSRSFYKLFNATSDTVLIPGATDFRLFDKAIRKEFVQFTERYRITRGLIDWMGFKRTTIEFHARERMGGQASYKVSKLFGLALNSFVSLSMAPLYIIGYVGIFITVMSLVLGTFVLIEQPILSDPLGLRITGTAMIGLLTLSLVGIVMMSQGLLAIYLSHIHAQTQNRPLYIIDHKNSIGVDS